MKLLRKKSFWLLLLAAGAVGFFVLKQSFNAIEVKTALVLRKDFELTVTGTSTGTVKSERDVRLTAQRPGRVTRLFVVEGSRVSSGSPVAELDTEEMRLNMELSEASFRKMEASLNEAKTALEPLRAEIEAAIKRTDAALREAGDRRGRFRELLKVGYVSRMELDGAERDYEVAEANYSSAMAGREQLKARAQEIKAREAALMEAKSALSLSKLNYDYSFIKAPISGIVTAVAPKVGDSVMKGSPVASMIAAESFYVESFVDEADVGRLKEGQRVYITMDAYRDRTFKGELYMISPVVLGGRLEARTFEVRTRLLDKDVLLKQGMSADAEIVVDRIGEALVVPTQAVKERGGKKLVYVVEGGRARLREIKPGASDWTSTQVASGLKESDEVILTQDMPGLKDGVRVKSVKE